MKKCILVNCFAMSNEMRVEPIREVLDELGYETIYISSDFNHSKKVYDRLPAEIVAVHAGAYLKNLSIQRLYSHYKFSENVLEKFEELTPDLIYIKFPPNSLVKVASRYKKKNPNCKIILDLFDLWPEALPIPSRAKNILLPMLHIWQRLRDKYLFCSDVMITECNMYREILKDVLPSHTHTLYLTKKDIDYNFYKNESNELKICYLGGINNLIDLETVDKFFGYLCKQNDVTFEIIGDGSRSKELIEIAENQGCKVNFHGIVYDEIKKKIIMQHCDFGINLMRDTTKVALTLKSIEYLRAGIALINNIPFDTHDLVNKEKCGINLEDIDNCIITRSMIDEMRINARKVYEDYFEYEIVKARIKEILSMYL